MTPEDRREYQRKYRERNRKKIRENFRRWSAENREKTNAKARAWYRDNKDKAKVLCDRSVARRRLKNYGVSPEEYTRMFETQKGLCAICGNSGKVNLAVDHDHSTGRVRALLCTACNHGIGKFKDDPIRVLKALRYLLLHHPERNPYA